MDRFEKFLMAAEEDREVYGWRIGQSLFNTLGKWDPALAREIGGTDLDPFYDETRTGPFMAEVQRRWEDRDEAVPAQAVEGLPALQAAQEPQPERR